MKMLESDKFLKKILKSIYAKDEKYQKKKKDHFHYTGKYRNNAHSVYNLTLLMMSLFFGCLRMW